MREAMTWNTIVLRFKIIDVIDELLNVELLSNANDFVLNKKL